MDWLIEQLAEADRSAFVHRGEPTTYSQLAQEVVSQQAKLREQGVGAGSRVALVADYSPLAVSTLLALSGLAAIIIPLSGAAADHSTPSLAVSGCDFKIRFNNEGRMGVLERHSVHAENPLLDRFRQLGTAGLVLFSSGSSGTPKAMLHDMARVSERFRGPRRAVTAIPFLSMDHFGGINTILGLLASHSTIVTTAERSLRSICQAIERHRIELLPTTPSFLTLLMASDFSERYDLSSLTKITYGSEPMPQVTLDRLRTRLPQVQLQQTYGLSELGVLHSKSREDGSLWVKLGGDGFETQVREGILYVRSAYRMVGYLNAPSSFDADGWFNTQDRVEVDGDYFLIRGRASDLINVGGQKVYPAEVEEILLQQRNVVEASVCGEPHPLLGQIVTAKVLLNEPEDTSQLRRRLRLACQAALARYKVPAKIEQTGSPLHSPRFKKLRG